MSLSNCKLYYFIYFLFCFVSLLFFHFLFWKSIKSQIFLIYHKRFLFFFPKVSIECVLCSKKSISPKRTEGLALHSHKYIWLMHQDEFYLTQVWNSIIEFQATHIHLFHFQKWIVNACCRERRGCRDQPQSCYLWSEHRNHYPSMW